MDVMMMKLMIWKNPEDVDLGNIMSVLRRLYLLDELLSSRNKMRRIAGGGTAMSTVSTSKQGGGIICHNYCGMARHSRKGVLCCPRRPGYKNFAGSK